MKGFFLFLTLILFTSNLFAQFDQNNYTEEDWQILKKDIEEKLSQQLANYLEQQGAPGGCIGINYLGPIQVCAGLSDRENETPMTADLYYRIASTTKTFTAASILKLAEEEKLSLNDTIDKYFDLEIPNKNIITIYQLLHMSSGLYNYLDEYYSYDGLQKQYTPQELIETAISKGVEFAPGQGYSYSNTNYVMLGLIIEQASGLSYADYIKTVLLENKGLTHTFEPDTNTLPEPFAKGYVKQEDQDIEIITMNPSAGFATGSMVSTVQDMTKWTTMLLQGEILSEQGMTELLDFSVEMDAGYYGGGLEKYTADKLGPLPSENIVGKVANILGYTSIMTYDMDTNMTIVVFINYENNMQSFLAADMAMQTMGVIKESVATFEYQTKPEDSLMDQKYAMHFFIFIAVVFMVIAFMKA